MKERLDVLLVKQGLAESREKAKAIIMSGNIFINGQREDKAGTTFDEERARPSLARAPTKAGSTTLTKTLSTLYKNT